MYAECYMMLIKCVIHRDRYNSKDGQPFAWRQCSGSSRIPRSSNSFFLLFRRYVSLLESKLNDCAKF